MSMNILKRKIEAQKDDITYEPAKVSAAFTTLSEKLVAELKKFDGSFRYEVVKIDANSFDIEKRNKEIPAGGAFFGYGSNEKSTTALLCFDAPLCAFVSDASFGKVDIPELASKETPSSADKLTLLLLEDMSQIFREDLTNHYGALGHTTKDISLSTYNFDEAQTPFARLKFDITVKRALDKKQAKGKINTLEIAVDFIMPSATLEQILQTHALQNSESQDANFLVEELQTYWSQRVDHSHTRLKLVLEEFNLSVADCTRLQIGDILPLPSVSLMEIKVHADFNDNEMCIASAALGIYKTHRAARLIGDLDPVFLNGVNEINSMAR